jgi:uncharacterized membrane protein YeaQ/YmgE (transglycosylase-associated protein family)
LNIFLWMLVGAGIGWIGYTVLGFNEALGRFFSIVVGAIGGIVGGKELAPVFATPLVGEVSVIGILFAMAVAGLLLGVIHAAQRIWRD